MCVMNFRINGLLQLPDKKLFAASFIPAQNWDAIKKHAILFKNALLL